MPAVAGFPVADVVSKLLVCKTRSLHVLEKPVLNATIVENIDGKYPVAGKLPDNLALAVCPLAAVPLGNITPKINSKNSLQPCSVQ